MSEESAQSPDKKINSGSKRRALERTLGHGRRRMVILTLAVLLIALAAWMLLKSDNKPTVASKNPLVASYQKQLPALASAAQKNPKNAQSQEDYAVALYATGDVAKAQTIYETAVKLDPNNAILHNNLGNAYRDLGSYQKAVDAYQTAIHLNPKTERSYVNLANLYLYTLNQKDTAIKTYQEALRNIPNNQELQVLLGIAYEQSGDKASAKTTFQQTLAADPNNVAAQAGLKRVQ